MDGGSRAQRSMLKLSREQRIAAMDKNILDVEGAAALLGVSTRTIYNLARKGEIPATRVGREWRFARQNLIAWVANGSQADQLAAALRNGRAAKKQLCAGHKSIHEHMIASHKDGHPVIVGTQITVEAIVHALAAGETVEQVLMAHPELSREAILAALAFAAEKVQAPARASSVLSLHEALGAFVPQTPLAKELWELRQAALREALERGEPLLQRWDEVRREVRERRGERDHGDDA